MATCDGPGDIKLLPGKPRSGGRPRSEANRRSILTAAMKLLEHQTVQSVTSEAIAAEAGVGKATIYRWWPSKVSVVIDAFIEHQLLHTPMDKDAHPAEALLKHWRMMAKQYSGKAGDIASQIIAAGQSEPVIMAEFLRKFHVERAAMARDTVERLMRAVPSIRERIAEERFMELFYSPIHTRLLLRHHPIDREFIRTFPVDFFRVFGVEFHDGGRLRKLPRAGSYTATSKIVRAKQ
ncbi:TetR/AcrR family transcriptional regulator [Bradyrhizobium sp. AC87j1]|uniref:TetR/AcrR family transcriptional regulator n=1 Tax=Bradyrhizobium sp. AC87j1 TaxID=2055894 RepID=UPI0024BFBA06|nr:TetR/AcrR family transcriptional regulator [Bradyrhizobium sp. AC87j1]